MIVIGSKEGQFANRVVHFAHILSFCKANNIKLFNPYFSEYSTYFPNLKNEELVKIARGGPLSKLFNLLFNYFIRSLKRIHLLNIGFLEIVPYDHYEQNAPIFNLSQEYIIKKARKKILVLYGWMFRDQKDLEQQEEYIKKIFLVRSDYVARSQKLVSEVRKSFNKIVGVHIRRGDYKKFEGGKWYYDDETYSEKIRTIKAQLTAMGDKVAFIICTNDTIDHSKYKDSDIFHWKEHFVVDYLLLSECDFIMGPPSTFSNLAAFMGNKKIKFIRYKEEPVRIEDFEYIKI